ncbi:hypothetical protein ACTFIW_003367 [Dictyostelium discoideum]
MLGTNYNEIKFCFSNWSIKNVSSTAELLMKSWEPSTLKVYSSSYTRLLNFCTLNSLNLANITLVVIMDYLTHLFKEKANRIERCSHFLDKTFLFFFWNKKLHWDPLSILYLL